jgi:hypothetical protein
MHPAPTALASGGACEKWKLRSGLPWSWPTQGGKSISEKPLHYAQQRPQRALADRTPEEFASVAMPLSFALSVAESAKDLTQEAVCVERSK